LLRMMMMMQFLLQLHSTQLLLDGVPHNRNLRA
jgi:hypothetical protein